MKNKELFKRKIIYRSSHRGTKEMDLLLGSFVKKYISKFNDSELKELEYLISIDDESISNWYFKKEKKNKILDSKVSLMLKKFKI